LGVDHADAPHGARGAGRDLPIGIPRQRDHLERHRNEEGEQGEDAEHDEVHEPDAAKDGVGEHRRGH
jgi:hypothetical protein